MLPAHILELIGKKLSGDASPGELRALADWEALHPEAAALEAFVQSLEPRETTFVQLESGAELLEKGWSAVSRQLAPVITPRRHTVRNWAVAAGVAALMALGWWGIARYKGPAVIAQQHQSQVSTRHGSKTKIELPDGTRVWLNAGSKLTYADDFAMGNREVHLSGEAYFEVTGDAGHPLVVHTPAMQITVLGTCFNVKAYKEDLWAEATLLNGKIAVTLPDHAAAPVVLRPLEKLTVDQLGRFVTSSIAPAATSPKAVPVAALHNPVPDSVVTDTAWISNHLQFKKEPFDDVMRKLERWYNVTIIVQQEGLHNELVSGAFTTETVTQALKALQYTTSFHFTMQHDTIMIQ